MGLAYVFPLSRSPVPGNQQLTSAPIPMFSFEQVAHPSLTVVHTPSGYPEAPGQKKLPTLREHRSALQQPLATVETAAARLAEGGDDDADAGARTAETGSLKAEVDRARWEVAGALAGVEWIWKPMGRLGSELERRGKEVECVVEKTLRGKAEVGKASKVLRRAVLGGNSSYMLRNEY